MEINRNQWFMIGTVVLLLGLQLRMVGDFWLNEDATRFLAERSEKVTPAQESFLAISSATPHEPTKVIRPPEWMGWCLVSVGSVLVLHSMAMPKPG